MLSTYQKEDDNQSWWSKQQHGWYTHDDKKIEPIQLKQLIGKQQGYQPIEVHQVDKESKVYPKEHYTLHYQQQILQF